MMRRINKLHTAHPFYGAWQMAGALRLEVERAGRNRVRRLMQLMGISAVAPKTITSVKSPPHKVSPCLLKDMEVTDPDQAWCADITYIPMQRASCTWWP